MIILQSFPDILSSACLAKILGLEADNAHSDARAPLLYSCLQMISTLVLVLATNASPDLDVALPFSRVTRRLTQTVVPPGVDTLQDAFNAATAGDVLAVEVVEAVQGEVQVEP